MIPRTYYDAATLKRTVAVYEEHFGMSSADFFAAHIEDALSVRRLPGYHRHIWASVHRELDALCEHDDLSCRIERELELA